METLKTINWVISIIFLVCYSYQFFYIPVAWLGRRRRESPGKLLQYAVLICARNERTVIADLIRSIKAQTYDASAIHVFVLADNCTDDTAAVARDAGATVYERCNRELVGKGYALQALMAHLKEDYPAGFDGFFIFDADNILSPDYIEQMHRTFSQGYDVVTGYRNTKNYGDNWISAGCALWFLRESRYLNYSRHLLGTSCAVGGTGFLFSRAVAEELGDWPYHLLVEDIEFSVDQILRRRRIAFCPDAVLYDEQTTGFRQSWHQRGRWARGYLQVCRRYGARLIGGVLRGSFACFDMCMSILPAFILSTVALVSNLTLAIYGGIAGGSMIAMILAVGELLWNTYMTLFALGAITTVTEWRRIRTSAAKKILYIFTFPLFMITFLPIALWALVHPVKWTPIEHKVTADALRSRDSSELLPF